MGNCLLSARISGTVKMDLLWTNPNPTSNFPQQTLTLDTSGYGILIITAQSIYNGVGYPSINVVLKGIKQDLNSRSGTDLAFISRLITATDSSIVFEQRYSSGGDNISVPVKIYGIKI